MKRAAAGRDEAGTNAGAEVELIAPVEADEDSIKAMRPRRIGSCPGPDSGRWPLAGAQKELAQAMSRSGLILLGCFAGTYQIAQCMTGSLPLVALNCASVRTLTA